MQNGSPHGPREPVPGTSSDNFGRTPLHDATISGDDETLERLLRSGVDRNAKDTQHGNTPLHEAAWRGYSRCVKLLCALPKQKAHKILLDLKAQKALQETKGALHSALLATRNFGGFTALHLAAQNGHNQSCREILLSGADPDVHNNYGDTPLHTACRYGHAGAVRILISAKCDPQRVNLNGDTALHISCAMGRRKLTRILLEAASDKSIKNAQGETARDIAVRKNLSEILSILDSTKPSKSPHRDRSSSSSRHLSKEDSKRKSRKGKDQVDKSRTPDPRYWSPYGCHYSPDPKDFPAPRLETLPKEPLMKGEQYYLDLAGNIRKGPIGVGNVCYCAPLFRHLESRISKNKKSIKKFCEKVDHKLDALANRTDDQIENLTKSIIADRIRCEDKKLYLKSWLKRGILQRQSLAPGKVSKELDSTNTLTRCRSLELVDPEEFLDLKTSTPGLSRSVDLLNCHNVTVHREAEVSETEQSSNAKNHPESDREKSSVSFRKDSSVERNSASEGRKVSKFKISKEPKHIRLKKKEALRKSEENSFDQDSLSDAPELDEELHTSLVTKRLEKLLLETKHMLQKEKVFQKIRKREDALLAASRGMISREQLSEQIEAMRLKDFDKTRNIEAEMELITKTLGQVLDPEKGEMNTSDENEEFVDDENILGQVHFKSTSFSENIQAPSEDEDSQDGEPSEMQQHMTNGFFANTDFNSPPSGSPATVRETPDICRTDDYAARELHDLKSRILGGTNWRSNVLQKSIEELRAYNDTPKLAQDVVDSGGPPGIVKRLASKLQRSDAPPTIPMPRLSLMEPTSVIPRDAYFHELPHKPQMNARNRNPLPMDVNENDILREDLLQAPQGTYYSNVMQLPPPRVMNRPPLPSKPPHLAPPPPLSFENGFDRDSQNDSGYSGRLYDSSHNPSPISGHQIDVAGLNGNLPRPPNGQLRPQNGEYYPPKRGASSLV